MEKGVLGMACLAHDFDDFGIDKAGDRVVQQKPAARAKIVNQITETRD